MELKKAIVKKVSATKRRLQPEEVTKDISNTMGIPQKEVKRAMSELVLEGELEFTYYGQCFVELPLGMSRSNKSKSSPKRKPSA